MTSLKYPNYHLLGLPSFKKRANSSKSAIYSKIGQGLWPTPVSIGIRAVAWPEHEINAVIAARIAGLSDDQIRALILSLKAARANALIDLGIEQ